MGKKIKEEKKVAVKALNDVYLAVLRNGEGKGGGINPQYTQLRAKSILEVIISFHEFVVGLGLESKSGFILLVLYHEFKTVWGLWSLYPVKSKSGIAVMKNKMDYLLSVGLVDVVGTGYNHSRVFGLSEKGIKAVEGYYNKLVN